MGRRGRAFWGAYAASKAATENLAQTLADELENTSRIRTNTLNPGATRTDMRALAYPGEDPATLKTPAQIVAPYLFLLGPDILIRLFLIFHELLKTMMSELTFTV